MIIRFLTVALVASQLLAEEPLNLEMSPENQSRVGVETQVLQATTYHPGMKVFGEVVDPTPYLRQWQEHLVAELAVTIADREYQRLHALNLADKLASDHAVETAQSTLELAQLQSQNVTRNLNQALGLGADSALIKAGLFEKLGERKSALVRLSLPALQAVPDLPLTIMVAPLTEVSRTSRTESCWLDPAAGVQKSPGFLALISTADKPLAAGQAVVGTIEDSSEGVSGWLLPKEAIILHEGEARVILKIGEDLFQQIPVTVDKSFEGGWFVGVDRFKAGSKIVVKGAQAILAQEILKAGGGSDDDD